MFAAVFCYLPRFFSAATPAATDLARSLNALQAAPSGGRDAPRGEHAPASALDLPVILTAWKAVPSAKEDLVVEHPSRVASMGPDTSCVLRRRDEVSPD